MPPRRAAHFAKFNCLLWTPLATCAVGTSLFANPVVITSRSRRHPYRSPDPVFSMSPSFSTPRRAARHMGSQVISIPKRSARRTRDASRLHRRGDRYLYCCARHGAAQREILEYALTPPTLIHGTVGAVAARPTSVGAGDRPTAPFSPSLTSSLPGEGRVSLLAALRYTQDLTCCAIAVSDDQGAAEFYRTFATCERSRREVHIQHGTATRRVGAHTPRRFIGIAGFSRRRIRATICSGRDPALRASGRSARNLAPLPTSAHPYSLRAAAYTARRFRARFKPTATHTGFTPMATAANVVLRSRQSRHRQTNARRAMRLRNRTSRAVSGRPTAVVCGRSGRLP